MRVLPALARFVFALFVIALLIAVIAPLGTRLGVWSLAFGLKSLMPWCAYIGLAALVLGVIWLIASRTSRETDNARWAILGLLGSGALIAVPIYNIVQAKISPPIHDITTDTEKPPVFVALLALRQGAENSPQYSGEAKVTWKRKTKTVREWQKKEYLDIRPFGDLTAPKKLFDRAHQAAEAMGWDVVAVVPGEGRIEATDTTWLFGQTDDIVIRVKPAGIGAKLDIRSESRMGAADDGRNAERVRNYIKMLQTLE
jgi:hypothetical protein